MMQADARIERFKKNRPAKSGKFQAPARAALGHGPGQAFNAPSKGRIRPILRGALKYR